MTSSLFNEFSDSSLEQWKERLATDLKGIRFEDLSNTDRNGLPIFPFYTQENGRQLPARFTHSDWHICSRIPVTDAASANEKALKELQGGANALSFVISHAVDMQRLLQDIDTSIIHLRLEYLYADAIIDYPGAGDPNLCTPVIDPIAVGIATGHIPKDFSEVLISSVERSKCLTVAATRYQNAGANASYEIACVLAHANEYLNLLSTRGALNHLKQLNVSVAVGTLYFEEIAKLRALRANLESLLAAHEVTAEVYLHVESSDIYRAPFDVHSNLLRDSIAGMAAVIGGCNALSLHPFNEMSSGATEQSVRMSRNQQLIFKEEAYLNRVADMAAGSFYLDELSDLLADASWEAFHEIESKGGFLAGLSGGDIPAAIRTQGERLIAAYRSGEKVLIGVNKYPNPTDPVRKEVHPVERSTAIIPLMNLAITLADQE